MINSYTEINDRFIDALREVGNIGSGNAATSLSLMIDESVHINVPQVMIVGYDRVVSIVGEPEEPCIAVMVKYGGDVHGIVLLVLSLEDANNIADTVLNGIGDEAGTEEFSELKISMIKEIGNILGSSYLGSLSTLTGLHFDISLPFVSIDMIGAVLNAPLVEFSMDSNKILLIEGSFYSDARIVRSHVILFADVLSLDLILTKLGIE